MSTPSSSTRPAVVSYRRGTSAVIVVLPQPVGPTSATVSPGRDAEVEPGDDGLLGVRVAEADVLEDQLTAGLAGREAAA